MEKTENIMDRTKVEEILTLSCPQIIEEPDWLQFMIDELLSAEKVESEVALFNLLGIRK